MDKFVAEQAYTAMETIKNAPEWSQNMNLILLCKTDKTGQIEAMARLLAKYEMPTEKIVPFIMDYLQSVVRETVEKE